ncbi:MAG: malto-oligosyltrehalose trehalohydrolase [Acidobacteria bacterium]|nr:malto-oligosyltrehalose trehalohydrolase [Acidobacteriota bacterium]
MPSDAPAPVAITPRRFSIGAEAQAGGGVHFRVWAPAAGRVDVVFSDKDGTPSGRALPLLPEADGYFAAMAETPAGARYWIQLDGQNRYADPASRFQPEGPHGPSAVIDPFAFRWTDAAWGGITAPAPIAYELHVGTFTAEGTWRAAAARLPALAALGVEVIELMPVAEFPGRFGWGYDGVLLFAPTRLYGEPDDMRAFVDQAHALGLGVILDVVYNHVGPDGCHLAKFSPDYFSPTPTEWGQAINYDGRHCGGAREMVVANAGYWIEEFHVDGLRLDATQSIKDTSKVHILTEVVAEVRQRARGRRTWIVAENEPQESGLLRAERMNGHPLDALWNDDFHHSAHVALTGRREAYYTDYRGRPQEFVSAVKYGFLYQGQWYAWQRQRRGQSARGLPPASFVCFLENHDQVANSRAGLRLHQMTSPGRLRAMTALLLLGPWAPLLFQGQEFAASAPFLYFADHGGDLAGAVRSGRREFLAQFPSLAAPDLPFAAPEDPETFRRCALDWRERALHTEAVDLHRTLIALRRTDPAFHDAARFSWDGAVLSDSAFALRAMDRPTDDGPPSRHDRLVVINLGADARLDVVPEPLLSPAPAANWRIVWSSEDPAHGGAGTPPLGDIWTLPAESALVLAPEDAP